MKLSVYIATSLDGYIARDDGALDWLPQPGDASLEPAEDYGYHAFMASIDALIMGRNTFDKVLSFGVEWPYGDKRVYVLSNRPVTIPEAIQDWVQTLSGSPAEIVATLQSTGKTHAYLDGGLTIQQFLRAGLVDELIISTIPVLIGSGIPLFGPLTADIEVTHVKTEAFASGIVQSRYTIVPS